MRSQAQLTELATIIEYAERRGRDEAWVGRLKDRVAELIAGADAAAMAHGAPPAGDARRIQAARTLRWPFRRR